MTDTTERKAKPKGFAALTREEVQAIASKGGKACQATGKAHRFTHEEAQAAGRKGGLKVSQDRAHMSAIGQKADRPSRASKEG